MHAHDGSVTYGTYEYDFITAYEWSDVRTPYGNCNIHIRVEKLNLNPDGLGIVLSLDEIAKLLKQRIEIHVSAYGMGMCGKEWAIVVDATKYFGNRNLKKLKENEWKTAFSEIIYEHLDHIYDVIKKAKVKASEYKETTRAHHYPAEPSRPHDTTPDWEEVTESPHMAPPSIRTTGYYSWDPDKCGSVWHDTTLK
jgi:hypothetical protein